MKSVTVVVPFFNRSSFFYRLIKSVERQTLKPTQLIIVDNGSELEEIESIFEVIQRSPLNILLVSTVNRGNANYARNLGYELAAEGYVAYLDSDDWWDEQHLENSVCALGRSNLYGVYSGAKIHSNKITSNKSIDVNALGCPFRLLFSKKGYIAQTSSYVLKKGSKLSPSPWDERLKRHQDFDFFIANFFSGFGWKYLDSVTVNIDWDDGGTKSIDIASKLRFYNKWKQHFPDDLCEYYLYNQVVYCLKVEDGEFKDLFKQEYLERFGGLKSRLLLNDLLLSFRIELLSILDKYNLKYKLRSILRVFSK